MDRGENLGKLQKPRGDWSIHFPDPKQQQSQLDIWGHGQWFGAAVLSPFGETRMSLDRNQLHSLATTILEMLAKEGYVDE